MLQGGLPATWVLLVEGRAELGIPRGCCLQSCGWYCTATSADFQVKSTRVPDYEGLEVVLVSPAFLSSLFQTCLPLPPQR